MRTFLVTTLIFSLTSLAHAEHSNGLGGGSSNQFSNRFGNSFNQSQGGFGGGGFGGGGGGGFGGGAGGGGGGGGVPDNSKTREAAEKINEVGKEFKEERTKAKEAFDKNLAEQQKNFQEQLKEINEATADLNTDDYLKKAQEITDKLSETQTDYSKATDEIAASYKAGADLYTNAAQKTIEIINQAQAAQTPAPAAAQPTVVDRINETQIGSRNPSPLAAVQNAGTSSSPLNAQHGGGSSSSAQGIARGIGAKAYNPPERFR